MTMGASHSLLTEQLANKLASPLAIVCRYVDWVTALIMDGQARSRPS
jgi:hypothetical protein